MHWWLEPGSPLTWLCSCMDCILYLMCICCSKWLLFSCLETRRLYFVTAFFFLFFPPFLLYCTWGNCKCFSMAFKQEENKLFYIKHYAGDAYIFPFTTLVLVLFGWYDELKFQDVWIFFLYGRQWNLACWRHSNLSKLLWVDHRLDHFMSWRNLIGFISFCISSPKLSMGREPLGLLMYVATMGEIY